MHRENASYIEGNRQATNAIAITAGAFGVYAGLLGLEHGYFEAWQGNVTSHHLRIFASSLELPFPFGHEPALTLIPNFLIMGLVAMTLGVAIMFWSTRFLRGKRGATVLFLLSIALFLSGGGFGPISLLIVACVAASRIGKELRISRILLPPGLRHAFALSWRWWLIASLMWVPAEFAAGQVFRLQNDHRQILTNLNLLASYPMLVFFLLSLIAAIAHELEVHDLHEVRTESRAS